MFLFRDSPATVVTSHVLTSQCPNRFTDGQAMRSNMSAIRIHTTHVETFTTVRFSCHMVLIRPCAYPYERNRTVTDVFCGHDYHSRLLLAPHASNRTLYSTTQAKSQFVVRRYSPRLFRSSARNAAMEHANFLTALWTLHSRMRPKASW